MEYLPLLIVFITLVVPIFLPLIYWYIVKNKTSKVYSVCRKIRRVWAILIVGLIAFKAYQLPQREVINAFEVMGEFFGQTLIAYLLWKVWKHDEEQVLTEEVESLN
jgi:hypothetical protein